MSAPFPLTSVGVIGFGSMGAALAEGIARSRELGNWISLCVYAKGERKRVNEKYGMHFTQTLQELVTNSDIIIIAVRPEQVDGVVRDLALCAAGDDQTSRRVLVSIAAGVPLARIAERAGAGFSVVRVMPNTLVEVGKGLFGFCAASESSGQSSGPSSGQSSGPSSGQSSGLSARHKEIVQALFGALGRVIELDESAMNSFTALAGCGPGFLFHIMDSLCEAGVSVGLTREAARAIAAELMDGCAQLAKTTGAHPVLLREQGTSPLGMTIAGLNHLDRTGVRGHVIDAVKAAYERGKSMDSEASAAG